VDLEDSESDNGNDSGEDEAEGWKWVISPVCPKILCRGETSGDEVVELIFFMVVSIWHSW
jgi:hypothetical protein